jgi:hypothetical protein
VAEVRDGVAALRTAAGIEFRARAGSAIAPGQQASLFVRPEKVALGAQPNGPSSEMNVATGRLKRTSFLGNIHRHAIEVAPGLEVTVDAQNAGGGAAPAPGGPAALSWRVADSLVLEG